MPNLTPFCSTDTTRFHLLKPFHIEGWEVATDGRLLIAAHSSQPPTWDIPLKLRENVATIVSDAQHAINHFPAYPVPEILPKPSQHICKKCDGTGKFKKCPECKGEGVIECPECGHQKNCRDCSATGEVIDAQGDIPCDQCDGLGYRLEYPHVPIGAAYFRCNYLSLIRQHLHQITLHPNGTGICGLYFNFEDGTRGLGALMPVYSPSLP